MTLETNHGAGRKGWAPLRSALSVVVAAAFAVTISAPSQFAFAGVGGAGVLDHASTADQLLPPSGIGSAAPGAFSYPAANVLDCDSCHRPHGAHDSSTTAGGKYLLLEYTTPGTDGTSPCLECHNPSTQCGFTPAPAP